MKALKKEKIGYLLQYVADIKEKDVEFAKLQQIKLATRLNIYADKLDQIEIDQILLSHNRIAWPYDNEIKWLNYKFVGAEPVTGELRQIRKSCFWEIERSTVPKTFGDHNIEVYNCFTTLRYLKYLNEKYGLKAWVFTDKLNKKSFLLKQLGRYNDLIKKGKVVIIDPFLAKQCLKLRQSNGHKTEFIYDAKLIPKYETKSAVKRKTIEDRLVCITDGITVARTERSKAEKLIKNFPSMHYCKKEIYRHFLRSFDEKSPKFDRSAKKSVLSVQGAKNNSKNTRTRSARRMIKQKRKLYSREYFKQRIPGKWVPDMLYPGQEVLDKSQAKTIIVKHSPPSYKARFKRTSITARMPRVERVFPPKFNRIETEVKGITISKFPYNKPIVVQYATVDKDGVQHHHKEERVMVRNKKVVKYDNEIKEDVILCSIKDVEIWCHQEDYVVDDKGNIDPKIWIPFIKIVPIKKVKFERIEFHLPRKNKKTKQWRHPIKGARHMMV